MKYPLSMVANMAGYIVRNKRNPPPAWQKTVAPGAEAVANPFKIIYTSSAKSGVQQHPYIHKRFPIVLQLEPLHACNLTCTGCGRIREYENVITQRLTLEQCVRASDECGAPTVAICGGEPLLYPEIGKLSATLLDRGRHVILCTNGMFIQKKLAEFKPHDHFFWNVHLDGLEKTHDLCVEKEGVFRQAMEGLQAAKKAGFRVMTNTTVYQETDMNEIWQLFEYLEQFNVDGHTISPAYGYSSVNDREIFMTRDDIREKFKEMDRMSRRFKILNTPGYSDFLAGKRELPCTAWGNPTYNVMGWKGPCYLITDAHYKTFEELMTRTQWDNYGPGCDSRCDHCMVHVGFEPSAALGINNRFTDGFKQLFWLLS